MIELLYQDNDIVVCIKPSGVLSAADMSGKRNIPEMLAEQLSVNEVFPVHRLDKEVRGIMVFALNKTSAARLSADMANNERFIKRYIAVVSGCPQDETGVFEDLLFKDSAKNKSFVVKKLRRGVKSAKLEYKVLESAHNKTLVEIRLFTGRTHQIRVQFASRGMPILGDRKYGGAENDKGIALYSYALEFYHPTTGEKLKFSKDLKIDDLI